MAAWTEPEKTKIRHYMGSGIVNAYGFYPPLEDSMLRVLAEADGGNQIDSSTQVAIQAQLTELDDIEARRRSLRKRIMVDTAKAGGTEARIDPARGLAALRMEGRICAASLARYLGFKAVLTDIFTAAQPYIPPLIGPDLYSTS